jgi:ribosome-associated translation inhibitor RaiA
MQSTLKITARDFPLPDWLEAEIRDKSEKLERFSKDIVDCEVAVDAPVGHHRKGSPAQSISRSRTPNATNIASSISS